MGPSSSTKSIPETVINFVIWQNSIGIVPTRTDVQNHLKKNWELNPFHYGLSNEGNTYSNWESSVYPTFRSMYARAKNNSGGIKGLENQISIVTVDDVDFVYHVPTWLKYSAGASIMVNTNSEGEQLKDIHTTLQFKLCKIGKHAGYKIYVPNSDRNKRADNGLKIYNEFGNELVNEFIGFSNHTKEIDVIFLTETNLGYQPIKAFEVENSTGVVKGLLRLKSLGVDGTIVSTQKSYRKIFDDSMNEGFSDIKEKIKYVEYGKIIRFAESIDELESSLSEDEIILEMNKKI
jgi:hypothetical protein